MEQEYDLIVGIPSYNEADSIEFVVKKIDEGIQKYFSDKRSIILNVDNNSPDNTRDVFLNTKTETKKEYITTPEGVKGKGNNFWNLFKFAVKAKAKAVVVVDADLLSITPEWIKRLGKPVFSGTDFVSPLYIRHKYDGTITNNIVFPLIFSLFNKCIRQPIGGDFAVSGKLVEYYLEQEWTETTRQYGIDNFMTMNAILGGFKTDQVMLDAKIHKPSAPKLGPMFIQVVNTLFGVITSNIDKVKYIADEDMPKACYDLPDVNPPDLAIDTEKMKITSMTEFQQNKAFLRGVLDLETYTKIKAAYSNEDINISPDLWAEIVFNLLRAYPKQEQKIVLVEALKPLYFGRTYTFIKSTQDLSSLDAEKQIIEQAEIFWRKKKILLDKI